MGIRMGIELPEYSPYSCHPSVNCYTRAHFEVSTFKRGCATLALALGSDSFSSKGGGRGRCESDDPSGLDEHRLRNSHDIHMPTMRKQTKPRRKKTKKENAKQNRNSVNCAPRQQRRSPRPSGGLQPLGQQPREHDMHSAQARFRDEAEHSHSKPCSELNLWSHMQAPSSMLQYQFACTKDERTALPTSDHVHKGQNGMRVAHTMRFLARARQWRSDAPILERGQKQTCAQTGSSA